MIIPLDTFTRCLAGGDPQRSLDDWCAPGGGLYALTGLRFHADEVDRSRADIGRYASFLPLAPDAKTIGTGWTPVRRARLFEREILLKDERQNPMGSFKDRGMCVLANAAAASFAQRESRPVFVDSVGNTAAALAGFARALEMDAHVFAPLATSPARARIVEDLGARLHLVAGPREESAKAAIEAAGSGALYLSHIYQPLFQAGTASCAFEIHEQLGPDAEGELRAWGAAIAAHRRPGAPLPDRVFLAVGQGSLLLGLWHGFRALVAAGEIDAMPQLVAVRPEDPRRTIAVGASSLYPVRANEVRSAIAGTGGATVRVPEPELLEARDELRAHDLHVDPAGALAVAGWRATPPPDERTVDLVILTGADREHQSGAVDGGTA